MRILFGIYYTLNDLNSLGIFRELNRRAPGVMIFPHFAIRDDGRAQSSETHVLDTLAHRIEAHGIDTVIARGLTDYFDSPEDVIAFRARLPHVKLVDISECYPYALYRGLHGDMHECAIQSHLDLVLVGCHSSVAMLRDHGVRAEYFVSPASSMLFDLPPERAVPSLSCDVIAPWYTCYRAGEHPVQTDRVALCRELLDGGVTNIRIYSGGDAFTKADPELAPYVRRAVEPDRLGAIQRGAKIGLNTSVIGENPLISPRGYWSVRVPSLMLSGCMVLTDCRESVTTPWDEAGTMVGMDDGVHLVTFDSEADAVSKARHYLAHEDERAAIAQAGHDFAVAHMTETTCVQTGIYPALESLWA